MKKTTLAIAGLLSCGAAVADINVGLTLSATGPAASLGIPERNTVEILPTEIAGEPVNYIVLNDGTDTTTAAKNARKLIEESNVDIILGSSTVPTSSAVAQIANESNTPQIALAPYTPGPEGRKWVFTIAQTNELIAGALFEHMKANGIEELGYIGYSDTWGDDWFKVLESNQEKVGYELTSDERFGRTDSSVTGQVLKVRQSKPDAVLIGATGTPAAMPHKELRKLGFKGTIYHTHGVANQQFLNIGGSDVDGSVLSVGPVVVWDKLPETHPSKSIATEYVKAYEAKFGEGSFSPFGAYLFDAYKLFEAAAEQTIAEAKPGTDEFRARLRDNLEGLSGVVGTHGVYTLSKDDHFGHDEQARQLITIENGKWELLEVK